MASKRKQEAYSVALRELESSRLYGQTPKMFELDQLANMLKKGRLKWKSHIRSLVAVL